MDAYVVEDTTEKVYGRGSGLEIQREADSYAGAPGNTDFAGGRYVQEAYTLLNLAVGVTHANWQAELFVDNVADENAELYIDTDSNTAKVSPNRPRTMGVRFSYDF